jgi:adenylosuccinate lyase
VTFFLADKIGKDTADTLMHDVSMKALNEDITLRQAIKKSDEISMYFSDKDLDILLNPETYIGLAIEQTKLVIQDIESRR